MQQPRKKATFYKLIVYGILPRAMVLIVIAAIFTMLCERTAGMLSNLCLLNGYYDELYPEKKETKGEIYPEYDNMVDIVNATNSKKCLSI